MESFKFFLIFLLISTGQGSTFPAQESVINETDPSGCEKNWVEFKKNYNKSYSNLANHEDRKNIFCNNLKLIKTNNVKSRGMTFAINHMSDWTRDELRSLTMRVAPPRLSSGNFSESKQPESRLRPNMFAGYDDTPDQLDYRTDPRIVGPVKNQGQCGSCWAFGLTGLMEAHEYKWDPTIRKISPLSEQQLIDCTNGDGCEGHDIMEALDYVKRVGGLEKDSDYQYISGNNQSKHECLFDPSKVHPPTRNMFAYFQLEGGGDEEYLKQMVATYGPILVIMKCPESFYNLASGIFDDPDCNLSDDYHSVLIVGYGTSASGLDYWIVKNSWSDNWAENGFAMMSRNRNNQCQIASYPYMLM